MEFNKIVFTDIDGVLRGKYVHADKLKSTSDLEICDVVFGWDINDQCYPKDSVTGWGKGFPDGLLSVDTSTKRTVPWESNTELLVGDFEHDENLKNACPRTQLKIVLAAYHRLGIYPKIGFEYEWYNFKNTPETFNQPKAHTLTRGMFGYSLQRLDEQQAYVQQLLKDLSAFDIPIDNFHTETGPGVYEASIQYGDALAAADQAALFKYAVKSIAKQNDIVASFMAKWTEDLPGCGGHMHISLQDENKKELIQYAQNQPISGISEYFLAGILEGTKPLFALYAPTINSYKRYMSGSWAATDLNWGFQNRTTAVRLIEDRVAKSHLEVRAPGADANPYLALTAALASGLYGIQHEMKLALTEQKGNAYAQKDGITLPKSLEEAVIEMKGSPLTKKMLNAAFIDHFLMTRDFEITQHQKAVTNWEINRYLDMI
jgi:glutamine synthetase